MAKAKTTAFFCKECGFESAKWAGQCPACRAWNTMVEEPVGKKESSRRMMADERKAAAKPVTLADEGYIKGGMD